MKQVKKNLHKASRPSSTPMQKVVLQQMRMNETYHVDISMISPADLGSLHTARPQINAPFIHMARPWPRGHKLVWDKMELFTRGRVLAMEGDQVRGQWPKGKGETNNLWSRGHDRFV